MKNKDDIFDRYIDEKTIEMISDGFPVLTEEEKDRIFASIERKININCEKNDKKTDSVDGVEKYERPQLVRLAGFAAALTIIIGGLGGMSYFLSNFNKNAPPVPQPEITTEAVTGTTAVQTTVVSNCTTTSNKQNDKQLDKNKKTKAAGAVTTTVATTSAVNSTNTQTAPVSTTEEPMVTETFVAGTEEIIIDSPLPTVPVTTCLPETTTEPVTTTTEYVPVIPSQEEAQEIATRLSDAYIKIVDINYGLIGGVSKDLTLKYRFSENSNHIYEQNYCLVDPKLYKSMDALREYYYSVVELTDENARLFGPDLTGSGNPNNDIYSDDDTDHQYITYNGKLYSRCNSYSPASISFSDLDQLVSIIHPNAIDNFSAITFTRYFDKPNFTSLKGYYFYIYEESPGKWIIGEAKDPDKLR